MKVFVHEVRSNWNYSGLMPCSLEVVWFYENGARHKEKIEGPYSMLQGLIAAMEQAVRSEEPYSGPAVMDLILGRAQVVEDVVRVVDDQPRLESDPIKLLGGPVPKEFKP